ncbi:ACP S-malonyltransferase [Neptuniibacter sp. QD37_6]|uniref:ACP S-malonyltransferase n=1 Tax=Neptuniibacter sp. QD37_6 TaxID=3398210 RepID=UPI0039F48916
MSAFIFPGQGIQRKGMGKELFPHFQEQVRQADRILGYSIESLCLEDPEQQLNLTQYTQPAIYVVSYLNYLRTMEQYEAPNFFLGHSVGEYAALTAAGAIDFETGLQIVKRRAELMSEEDQGVLAAIIGLSQQELQQHLHDSRLSDLYIANINSTSQIVIGGKTNKVDAFLKYCRERSVKAVRLRVSGAFHTPEMQPAEQKFKAFLATCQFQQPITPVISNLTGKPHKLEDFATNLSQHLTHPVQWVKCVEYVLHNNVSSFIEFGEPAILSPMIDDIKLHALKNQPALKAVKSSTHKQTIDRSGLAQFALPEQALSFCKAFRCRSPLLVSSLNGAAGTTLVASLAKHGTLCMLDCDHLSNSELGNKLQILNQQPDVLNKYGISLSSDIYKQTTQLELLKQYNIGYIEVSASEPSQALTTYKSEHPACKLVARIRSIKELENFYAIADAICLELSSANTQQEPSLSLFAQALAYKQGQSSTHSPYIGISGMAGNPANIHSWLSSGADFVIAGSVFTLTKEAELDQKTKQQLSQLSYAGYSVQPDWLFPDLNSSSNCYVLNSKVKDLNRQLQRAYLDSDKDSLNTMKQLLNQAPLSADPQVIENLLVTAPEQLSRIREQISQIIAQEIQPYLIPGDSSLALFNTWRQTEKHPTYSAISAGQLCDLLCPSINISSDSLEQETWN